METIYIAIVKNFFNIYICEMEALVYTVISSQNQYREYCERLAHLIKVKNKTRVELDTIDLLSLLIKRWDEEQRPLSDADPVQFLGLLIKQKNIKASALAAGVGISKSLLSDILHYRRRLSREVIRKLASRFNVSQELLNKPYNLAPVAKHAKPRLLVSQPKPEPSGTAYRKDQPLIRLLEERTGKATVAKLKNGKEITIWDVIPGRRLYDPCAFLMTNIKSRKEGVESDIIFTSAIGELIDCDTGQVIFQAEN
jgi:HTH-type transcriptional regulator / antitoxin HigA